ncbi:hypothetical protein [Lacrimispora sp.]|uniref:hypothetical protein n=1 Tax=Lacrimispora sp. TaxID=2719234 RepID=UPI0028A9F8F1|nr:hypothetical protein [Lacrimispora sp.]
MGNAEEKTLLFDGRLAAGIPDSFQAMESGRAELMYPYVDRPQIILEDADTRRFCTFSLLKGQKLVGIQVEYVIQSITKAIVSLYPSCLLSEPQLVEKEEGICGWYSFRTSGRERDLQNFMYIFPVDGCMMLGTMGCFMEDEEGKRQLIQIIESLEVCPKAPVFAKSSHGTLYKTRNQQGGIT